MKKIVSLSLVLVSLFAFTACGSDTGSDGQANVMGIESSQNVQNVSVSGAKNMIQSAGDDFVVLDVRTPAEYVSGHLADATNIDYEAADFSSKISKLDKSKTYLVYCRSGRRSAEASQIMVDSGFRKVVNMLGGINAWKEAGGEIAG